jgi:hypothetical protein
LVEVELANGTTDREERLSAVGSRAQPFSPTQYWEKFDRCVEGVLSPQQTRILADCLAGLAALANASELTEMLAGPAG